MPHLYYWMGKGPVNPSNVEHLVHFVGESGLDLKPELDPPVSQGTSMPWACGLHGSVRFLTCEAHGPIIHTHPGGAGGMQASLLRFLDQVGRQQGDRRQRGRGLGPENPPHENVGSSLKTQSGLCH